MYNVGDLVKIVDRKHGHGYKIGEIVKITEVRTDLEGEVYEASNEKYDYLITPNEFERLILFTDIRDEARRVSVAANKYGGSFIKALFCDALSKADSENMMKIKVVFSDEWEKYLELYELMNE